jgi:hypothetical protein
VFIEQSEHLIELVRGSGRLSPWAQGVGSLALYNALGGLII